MKIKYKSKNVKKKSVAPVPTTWNTAAPTSPERTNET